MDLKDVTFSSINYDLLYLVYTEKNITFAHFTATLFFFLTKTNGPLFIIIKSHFILAQNLHSIQILDKKDSNFSLKINMILCE